MICSSVLLKVVSILEVLVTESASDGLELLICSSVLIEVLSLLEVLVTEHKNDSLKLVICSSLLFLTANADRRAVSFTLAE